MNHKIHLYDYSSSERRTRRTLWFSCLCDHPTENTNGTGAALSEEVAALILARIPGATTEDAQVLSFSPEKNFYEFGPVTLDLRVHNSGQLHIQPQGQALIKGFSW